MNRIFNAEEIKLLSEIVVDFENKSKQTVLEEFKNGYDNTEPKEKWFENPEQYEEAVNLAEQELQCYKNIIKKLNKISDRKWSGILWK